MQRSETIIRGLQPYAGGPMPRVLLLHGFGETAHSQWLAPGWPAALGRASYGAFAWDLPGHGSSGAIRRPERFEVAALRRDIDELLAAFDLRRPVLIGHSLGARLALDFAIERRDAVAGLILFGVGGNVFDAFDGAG